MKDELVGKIMKILVRLRVKTYNYLINNGLKRKSRQKVS